MRRWKMSPGHSPEISPDLRKACSLLDGVTASNQQDSLVAHCQPLLAASADTATDLELVVAEVGPGPGHRADRAAVPRRLHRRLRVTWNAPGGRALFWAALAQGTTLEP